MTGAVSVTGAMSVTATACVTSAVCLTRQVNVMAFLWKLVRSFDRSSKGRSMQQWVNDQEHPSSNELHSHSQQPQEPQEQPPERPPYEVEPASFEWFSNRKPEDENTVPEQEVRNNRQRAASDFAGR